jgi:hypothetical protein
MGFPPVAVGRLRIFDPTVKRTLPDYYDVGRAREKREGRKLLKRRASKRSSCVSRTLRVGMSKSEMERPSIKTEAVDRELVTVY